MARPDDRILLLAAEQWLRQVQAARPVIGLAQHVIDAGGAALVVEIRIGAAGAERPLLLLDTHDTNKQTILWPPAPWSNVDAAADLATWRKLGLPLVPPE